MPQIPTFPEVVFITVEQDGSDDWLSANLDKTGSLGDNRRVIAGLYKFVEAQEISQSLPVSSKRKNRRTR